jgi:glycosyltransferase involved in cell wall biosynthesis
VSSDVAMVSDRLTVFGGAERVLLEMADLLGAKTCYTTFCTIDTGPLTPWKNLKVVPTWLQNVPFINRISKLLLPWEPMAIEQIDLTGADLIVSSSHAVAKGCIAGPEQCHIGMIYSPMRYAWELQSQYLTEMNATRGPKSLAIRLLLHRLRNWDVLSAARPHALIAISRFIAARIWACWGRPSTVIYPPVDVAGIVPDHASRDDFYITASRLVPYKRVDLIVEAFKRMPTRRLVVIGDGVDLPRIRRIVAGAQNIELTGFLPTVMMRMRIARAKAYVFAAVEDFGIAPLEAQAAGTPVIALGHGGALETILDGQTGILFPEQTVESLIAAIDRFESLKGHFAPSQCRDNANRFSAERFKHEFLEYVERCREHHRSCVMSGRFEELSLC